MRIVVLKETFAGERRVAATPDSVEKLSKLGAKVAIESGLGSGLWINDESYRARGAEIAADRSELLRSADMVLAVRPPDFADIALYRKGAWHMGFIDPFFQNDILSAMARQGISVLSMQMIPRTTLAQKMDALSSQANLGGYVAVVMAAERLSKIFPMMTTAAGTIFPARVFVVGVGVAGLQAIATAKRLGARVDAYDTRPVVEEQVKSLGARFVKMDVGHTGQTAGGYAQALTPEQLEKQRQAMADVCAASDVVITTAQVFGKKPPVLITDKMVAGMKPGSVIVDMAAESGGNVEGSVPDKDVQRHGVTVLGFANLPGRVAESASQVYASNLYHGVAHLWDAATKQVVYRSDDELIKAAVVAHAGDVIKKI